MNQQECRQVFLLLLKKSRRLFFCLVPLMIFTTACSHQKELVRRECPCLHNKFKQTLKIRITHPEGREKLTVYTKINREAETAELEGIGTLGKHVFTLNIKGDLYEFTDRINNKDFSGKLEEFSILPLNKELIFEKLDIDGPQPIIIKDEQRKTEVEINVTKQEEEN
jgi:hypothetical protein